MMFLGFIVIDDFALVDFLFRQRMHLRVFKKRNVLSFIMINVFLNLPCRCIPCLLFGKL